MAEDVLAAVRRELEQLGDQKTRDSFGRFFKEKVTGYGVSLPKVDKVAGRWFAEVKPLGKKRVFELCEELLKSGMIEEAFVAADWAYRVRDQYEPADFAVFDRWLQKYIDNWAECDALCNHAVGAFVDRYPEYVERLKEWARSDNLWVKRAAAVTLVLPARAGKFLQDVFEIADILLEDKDDLVQKGYGWMLKEASREHQDEVLAYVLRHKKVMPRTALRYAIEKMPPELRRRAMEKVA